MMLLAGWCTVIVFVFNLRSLHTEKPVPFKCICQVSCFCLIQNVLLKSIDHIKCYIVGDHSYFFILNLLSRARKL